MSFGDHYNTHDQILYHLVVDVNVKMITLIRNVELQRNTELCTIYGMCFSMIVFKLN